MIMMKNEIHPCFAQSCNEYARVHLPVAPKCNIQCNYCLRKFSCVNESRPGVTAKVMTPEEAFVWYKDISSKIKKLAVVGIAGPGDALANWNEVEKILKFIKEDNNHLKLCLSTNGLLLPDYIDKIIDIGIEYITVTLNCVDPQIGSKIYDYIYYGLKKYQGIEGAKLLLKNQLSGIKQLKDNGVIIKVNCVAIDNINEKHIIEVAKTVRCLGCDVMNIIPMIPVKGSKFENIKELSVDRISGLRNKCGTSVRQMFHCNRCRADAFGTLSKI